MFKKIFLGITFFSLGLILNAQSIKLSFIGDIMAHDVNYKMKDYNLIYANVKYIFEQDDLTFGNLEFPVVDDLPFATFPLFNVNSSYVKAAREASIEVFSVANNHTLDKSQTGVLKTLSALLLLKEQYKGEFYFSGIRGSLEKSFTPVTIYKKGFKIGFLAVTEFSNISQTGGLVNLVNYFDKQQAEKFLAYLRSLTPLYDIFIVSYHAGDEYQLSPSLAKANFFRELVKVGVTIVWGHHPHVLQPYEIIEVNGKKHLIMHSMGNFISGQAYNLKSSDYLLPRAYTGDSAILRVVFEKDKKGKISLVVERPILISTYRTIENNCIVVETEKLANSKLPGGWDEFYKKRLALLLDFFNKKDQYLPAFPKN